MAYIHIPDNQKPTYTVTVNGKQYTYPSGAYMTVPDDVAAVIKNNRLNEPPIPTIKLLGHITIINETDSDCRVQYTAPEDTGLGCNTDGYGRTEFDALIGTYWVMLPYQNQSFRAEGNYCMTHVPDSDYPNRYIFRVEGDCKIVLYNEDYPSFN